MTTGRRILGGIAAVALLAPVAALVVRERAAGRADAAWAHVQRLLDAPLEVAPGGCPAELGSLGTSLTHVSRDGRTAPVRTLARALAHLHVACEDAARGDTVLGDHEAGLALALAPREPAVVLGRAELALQREHATEARTLAAKLLGGEIPSTPALRDRAAWIDARALAMLGREAQARTAFETLDGAHPAAWRVALETGQSRARSGAIREALGALERAVRLAPAELEPRIQLARILAALDRADEARSQLESAVSSHPDDPRPHRALGILLAATNDAAARAALERADRLGPNHPETERALASLDLHAGRWDAAARRYARVLEADAHDGVARTNLGIARMQRGDLAGAQEAFEQAVASDPRRGEAWNGLGVIHLRARALESARSALTRAAALMPSDPNPALNLGLTLEALGRTEDAAAAFREALRRAPGHAVAVRHLAALSNRRA